MNMRARVQVIDEQVVVGFLIPQGAHVEAEVNRVVFPEILYPTLIPVDTSAHPFTSTVMYISQDMKGKAGWINGNSDDIPLASTSREILQTPVYTGGIGYGWGWEEINKAQMLGINLPSDDAMAAREASEQMIERVAFSGDAEKNFQGLYSYSGITIDPAAGSWTNLTLTPDQILADFNASLIGQFGDTNSTQMANTVLLPMDTYLALATRRMTDSDVTVLSFLRKENAFTAQTGQPLTIRGVANGLATAGVSGVRRAVFYRRDPRVLKLHMPMTHRFLPGFQEGPLRWIVPGVMRLGGLDIRRPAEVRYKDGV